MRPPERWISFGLFRSGECVAEGTVRGSGAVNIDPPVVAEILAIAGAPTGGAVDVTLMRGGLAVARHNIGGGARAVFPASLDVDRVVIASEPAGR
jgi:hypothetical protein